MDQQGPNAPPGPQVAGSNALGAVGVPPRPGSQTPQQQQPQQQQPTKNNRTTTIPKPAGLDPLLILQERENR